mmetsp:Transcript_26684/g.61405  ORF Transcript_26684/g.61405 Transcript_26684/m.61405 type:complete len:329 (-) Transcript_26684:89-1075(-)
MQICAIAWQLWFLTFGICWRCAWTLQLAQEQHDDRQPPGFGYRLHPDFPTGSESGATLERLSTEAYKHEEATSVVVIDSAKAVLSSQSASAKAARQKLLASIAGKQAAAAVGNTNQLRRQAERSLNATRELATELKLRTEAVIKRAIAPVIDHEVQAMDDEAFRMVAELKASRQKLASDAELAEDNVTAEYAAAVNQTRQTAIAKQAQASAKAENVIAMHNEAVRMATAAQQSEASGNVTLAKEQQQRAREVIRQAEQLKLQAESIDAMARELNAEVPSMQQEAGQAAAFVKYKINPVGDRPLEVPPLPVPLKLESAGGVPAPAPAPM